jgi:hypothetical protein
MVTERKPDACSFCGRHNDQVKRMIAGAKSLFSCDPCMESCCPSIATQEGRVTGREP